MLRYCYYLLPLLVCSVTFGFGVSPFSPNSIQVKEGRKDAFFSACALTLEQKIGEIKKLTLKEKQKIVILVEKVTQL